MPDQSPPDGRIHPVILCGGSGTRLWPVSRQSFPKQFSRLMGEESLFQATARRLAGDGFSPPVIVTSAEFRFIVRDQLAAIAITPAAILIEPEPRNTAPAVLAAALWLEQSAPGALMFVAPSDHLIPDADAFRACVRAAVTAAACAIVTFGITPVRAETGYGYLEPAEQPGTEPLRLLSFVEKPDAGAAARLLAGGRHLWNAGMLLARAETLIAAYQELAPAFMQPVTDALAAARPDLGFLRLDPAAWSGAPAISVDYALLEKCSGLWVMPYRGQWSDLGGWEAIWTESPRDVDGVARSGPVTALGCRDSLLRSEDDGPALVAIGLEDMVAVAMPDAVLVARRGEVQRVREAVEVLKEQRLRQATSFPRDRRPWGGYESLARGNRFQVKRIVVNPGAALSLQSHHHRSEHWIVVEGTARVTIGDSVQLITENQSVYIPLGARHRLENPGRLAMVLIEVQTGAYLEEDDIIRYEDVYARS